MNNFVIGALFILSIPSFLLPYFYLLSFIKSACKDTLGYKLITSFMKIIMKTICCFIVLTLLNIWLGNIFVVVGIPIFTYVFVITFTSIKRNSNNIIMSSKIFRFLYLPSIIILELYIMYAFFNLKSINPYTHYEYTTSSTLIILEISYFLMIICTGMWMVSKEFHNSMFKLKQYKSFGSLAYIYVSFCGLMINMTSRMPSNVFVNDFIEIIFIILSAPILLFPLASKVNDSLHKKEIKNKQDKYTIYRFK